MTDVSVPDDLSADPAGWRRLNLGDHSGFDALLGPVTYRVDGALARVRMTPEQRHANMRGAVHGGALMGFIDVALFAAAHGLGLIRIGTAVTLDLSTQFIGEGRLGEPLEAQVELLKETGRLIFLRGLLVQGEAEDRVSGFSGTIRKPSPKA